MTTAHGSCPCGFTKADLKDAGWYDKTSGLCTAIFKLNGVRTTGCGELYADHPSAPVQLQAQGQ